MSNVNKYTPHQSPADTSHGYVGRSYAYNPSIAQQTPKMPDAWQTRGIASTATLFENGQTVRSFADQAIDPIRWCLSSKLHMLCTVVAGAGLIALLA